MLYMIETFNEQAELVDGCAVHLPDGCHLDDVAKSMETISHPSMELTKVMVVRVANGARYQTSIHVEPYAVVVAAHLVNDLRTKFSGQFVIVW